MEQGPEFKELRENLKKAEAEYFKAKKDYLIKLKQLEIGHYFTIDELEWLLNGLYYVGRVKDDKPIKALKQKLYDLLKAQVE